MWALEAKVIGNYEGLQKVEPATPTPTVGKVAINRSSRRYPLRSQPLAYCT